MPVPPTPADAPEPDAFQLPDGTYLTDERAAETGQLAIDAALQRRPSAAA